jgi:nucleotide-binding universal stress UspA family protein
MQKNVCRPALRAHIRKQSSAGFIPLVRKFSYGCAFRSASALHQALSVRQPLATKGIALSGIPRQAKRYGRYRYGETSFVARLEIPIPDHHNLLVYYDGSPESRSALLRVTHLAHALRATVHVLSLVDIGLAVGSSFGHLSDVACLQIEGTVKQTLQEALDHLTESGTVARGYVAVGSVVDSMARYAGLLNADLLVLGHRNPRGIARWWGQPSNHSELVKRCAGRAVITVPLD